MSDPRAAERRARALDYPYRPAADDYLFTGAAARPKPHRSVYASRKPPPSTVTRVPPRSGPSAGVATLAVKCAVRFVDMEGLSDGRSTKTILRDVAPRRLVLIGADDAASAELAEFCRAALHECMTREDAASLPAYVDLHASVASLISAAAAAGGESPGGESPAPVPGSGAGSGAEMDAAAAAIGHSLTACDVRLLAAYSAGTARSAPPDPRAAQAGAGATMSRSLAAGFHAAVAKALEDIGYASPGGLLRRYLVGEDVGANGSVATETFKLEKPNDSVEQSPIVFEKLYPVLHSLVSKLVLPYRRNVSLLLVCSTSNSISLKHVLMGSSVS